MEDSLSQVDARKVIKKGTKKLTALLTEVKAVNDGLEMVASKLTATETSIYHTAITRIEEAKGLLSFLRTNAMDRETKKH